MGLQFKNMNELVEYLSILEQRVNALEKENNQLRAGTTSQANIDGNAITRYINRVLPQTNLVNPNFLKRAFTVWGHFFVANFIIGIIIGIGYACLMMVLFGSAFGSLIQLRK